MNSGDIQDKARFQDKNPCANLYAATHCAYVPMRFVSSFCSRVRTPTGKPTFLVACSARRLHLPRFTATRRRRKSGRPTGDRPVDRAGHCRQSLRGREASCEFRRCLALFSETALKFKSDPYVTWIGNTIKVAVIIKK